MKTNSFLILTFVLAVATRIASAADPLTEAFQKGLLEEEANRNLGAAIQAYESVLKQLDEQRKLAATTVFRLGECYRKLGKTNEATAQYQRILREFPDQDVLAKLSQQNLGALGVGGESKAKKPELLSLSLPDEETAEIERLKKMIKDSPDLINAPGPLGDVRRPLEKAAEKGQTAVVKFLLENRADPNTGALQLAANSGRRGIVELLLAHGANVNSLGQGGWAPLHSATSQGYRAVAETLIAAKADVNVRAADGVTPLHLAVRNRNQGLAELLLSNGANPNSRTTTGETPLHRTAILNDGVMAELLLKRQADVNTPDEASRTPLYQAVENGALPTCEVLLKHHADVGARISSSITRNAAVRAIEGAAAQNSAVRCIGFTPLHLAAIRENEPVVKLLLAHKADVNAQASQERTPLHLAITYSTPAVIKALLEGGADVNVVSSADSVPILVNAIKRQSEEIVSMILARKPNLEQRDPDGLTALQIAVGRTPLERVTDLLLEAGADPNVSYERDGATPLHWAVSTRNRKMVETLLKHKANPNAADSTGKTPLDYAKALAPQNSGTGRRAAPMSRGPSVRSGSASNQIAGDILQLLRKAGATEYPQRPNSIMIGRGDVFSVVFSKDTGEENRYTLMEAVGTSFRSYVSPSGTPTAFTSALSFPDFAQVRILRSQGSDAAADEEITVNLEKALQSGDCSKDIPLRWGDLIEIPEKEHKLNESWLGLSFEVVEPLRRCLQRSIHIRVKGKGGQDAERHPLLDLFPGESGQGSLCFYVRSFRLDEVLNLVNVHRTSSDLTRVKVKRVDPDSKEARDITVNLFDSTKNFWLRNGDAIEVPERE